MHASIRHRDMRREIWPWCGHAGGGGSMAGTSPVVIIGAGPYGLAAAAHLRAAGVEARVFGEAMAFWARQMPAGMLLRSYWDASHIADPARDLTLDAYDA